jgi:hypothetical protein
MKNELSREMVLISIVAVVAVVGVVGITKIGTTPMEFIAEEMPIDEYADNLITGDAINDCSFYIDSAIAFDKLAEEAESEEMRQMYFSMGVDYAETAVEICN